MKTKITALFLALLLVLSLTACGGGSGTIGETCITDDGVEITLHYAEFGDRICNTPYSEDFWKPASESTASTISPVNDSDVMLTFGFTFKNGSKEDIFITDDFHYKLDYNNGYTYNDPYVSCHSNTGSWEDLHGYAIIRAPLSESMEIRAYMIVPKEVMDESKPLTLTLFGQKYDLRK